MATLPEEIIREILLQLPVKSLGRFRLVSKNWNSLTWDPDFAQSHLTRDPDKDEYLIINNTNDRGVNLYISIMSRNNLSENRINKLPYSVSSQCKAIRLIGSVNGLVCIACLFKSHYHFILWNPLIGRSKKILPPKCFRETKQSPQCYMFAFGWDLVLNDYKLLVKFPRSSEYIIYSSNQDSWSDIFVSKDYSDLGIYVNGSYPSTIVKGCPYWCCSLPSHKQSIIKFDMKSNVFKFFELSYTRHSHSSYKLVNLNDCVARVEYGGGVHGRQYYMDVYCFNEECKVWAKMYTTNSWNFIWPLMCFKYGGEIVLDKKRCLYDHKSKQIKNITYIDEGHFVNGFNHTPTLVFVNGMRAV